ncbi:hypothetical protein HDU97_004297 [Phlyctochytrium planicorne]|nr:hypothetical protein HDU97_004297 [Phlyctochytrium planicorne]
MPLANPPSPSSLSKPPSPRIPTEPTLESKAKTDKKEEKQLSGLFGKRKNSEKKKGKNKIDKSMISAPTDFKHVSHVGYSPKTGFRAENIPLEWKAIFQKAGITEDQLKDKKTARFVQKFMEEATKGGIKESPTTGILSSATSSTPSTVSEICGILVKILRIRQ